MARAPLVVASMWLLTVLVSLPLALVLRGMIAQQLGHSMTADSVADGIDYDWLQEFADQASGVGVTLKPTIIGFGAVLDNMSAFVDNTARPMVVVAAASAYIAVWLFLAGGIIDRYARDRPIGAHAFFAVSGVYFFRFLRLAAIQWIGYALLFGSLHPYLFNTVYPSLTRETTVERTAFLINLVLYVVFGLCVAALNVLFDYAKVRAVVEDRRSMLGAIAAASRFISRSPSALGVYALNATTFVVLVVAYAVAAPGAGHSTLTIWLTVAAGQLFIVARLIVKLSFWASETALFQSRLAHAGYVAAPEPKWPESAAAEALQQ